MERGLVMLLLDTRALIWEYSDALYIDILWCNEQYREQGIGEKLSP